MYLYGIFSANGLKYHTVKTKCEGRGEYSAAINLTHAFDMEPASEDLTSDDELLQLQGNYCIQSVCSKAVYF